MEQSIRRHRLTATVGLTPDRWLAVTSQAGVPILVYPKSATRPRRDGASQFTFQAYELDRLNEKRAKHPNLFVALHLEDRAATCCLAYEEFDRLVWGRFGARGDIESNFVLLVRLGTTGVFDVRTTRPGTRNAPALDRLEVLAAEYPMRLFVR